MINRWDELYIQLYNEKIVAYKSDTVASIYCSLKNEGKLIEIKKRKQDKPFILLVSSLSMLLSYISKDIL